MLECTPPWTKRRGGQALDKKQARLNRIRHLLARFEYPELEQPAIVPPARVRNPDDLRRPVPDEMIVPEAD